MRILLFTHSYPPRVGGVEHATERLARELSVLGHSVEIVTRRYPLTLPGTDGSAQISVRRLAFPAAFASPRPTMWQRLKRYALFAFAPVASFQFARVIVRFHPHVVNAHYFGEATPLVIALARLLRVPVVLSFHGSDVPGTPCSLTPVHAVERAVSRARAVTCCSHDLHSRLLSAVPACRSLPVAVVHNGVDVVPVHAERQPRADTQFLIVARLVEKKGVDTAIRALGLCARRNCSVSLVVAGGGPCLPGLRALAEAVRVAHLVRFTGVVSRHEVDRLMEECAAVVVPSTWEAFGMVCLEAMAHARPVVATRSGGPAEIVIDRQTGLLVEPDDPGALADAMKWIMEYPREAAAYGCAGRRRAEERFTWRSSAETLLAAFSLAPGEKS